jgi:CSLREA domain-containing protein/uncharacterized repeat protein (TIGR01451 family)
MAQGPVISATVVRVARSHDRRLAAMLLLLFIPYGIASAADFTVNSTADDNDASTSDGLCLTAKGECTLRAAITQANSLTATNIYVPAGTYTITGIYGENGNTSGDYDIGKGMTITGDGVDLTIIDGAGLDRLFNIPVNSPVTIANVTIQNGKAPSSQDGGCISYTGNSTLTINNVKMSGCSSRYGGGITNNAGNMALTDVTISNCSAQKGGGLYANSGTVTLTRMTFSGNTASVDGGGLHNQSGHVSLTNVTISGNTCPSCLGGGIYNQSGTGPDLTNVTIYNNSGGTGGGIYSSSGNTTLKNSIIANSPSGGNCSGNIASNGYNLDSGSTCPFTNTGDQRNVDPKLGVLQDNGGQTKTHALLLGSPAIDAGTSSSAPATDQRGVSRPQPVGGAYDIGAFEGTAFCKPDAMIKLTSETAAGYLTDNVFESTAVAQSKNGGAPSGSAASYNILFQNDGNVGDVFKITGTGSGSGFTVQYLDDLAADQTAAVTTAGLNTAFLAPGASKLWTLKVTPTGGATPVSGGTTYNVFVTATSNSDTNKKDQVVAVTSSTSAKVTVLNSADKATVKPGEDITYTTVATNGASLSDARNVVIFDSIPANTAFKVGSGNASFTANNSTLSCTISYSRDNRATWTYTPTSGGCSAPAPLDYCVTDVRWTTSGTMPSNTSFSTNFVVQVK